jgi:hypothetical protein
MPRKWTNSYGGSGGGNVKHTFTEPAPGRTLNGNGEPVDLRLVNQILAENAYKASKERWPSKRK